MTVEELRKRRSVRSYSDLVIDEKIINTIKSEITFINSHEAGLHITLCVNDGEPFKGFRRSYGAFRNVQNYIVVAADTSFSHTLERAGYYGEQLVMLCVSLGLGTCFVSGTYDVSHVGANIKIGEKILFLITLGYENTKRGDSTIARVMKSAIHRKHMDASDFLECSDNMRESLLADKKLLNGLQGVAIAPSAVNRRPARISVDAAGQISALVHSGKPADLIDLGIAMYNFSAVYPGTWEWGNPATFIPDRQIS